MRLTILHDIHIGAIRSAGTTPESQMALRNAVREKFAALLPSSGDLLILGDLFDTSNVPILEVFETYKILTAWLERNPSSRLYNVAGNHDTSKTSNIFSSFQFLGALLQMQFGGRYFHIEQPQMTPHGYVVPHLRNQDLFNAALEAVPECDFLFVHCNIDNNFAAQSDQSLNMSQQQIVDCKAKQIICAHEHHSRTVGKVLLPGNQIATSVSDWLSEGDKFYTVIENGVAELHTAVRRVDEFIEMDWKSIEQSDKPFIRITGSAEASEVSGAITAINKLRSKSKAFVVTNAIQTMVEEGGAAIFENSLESVQKFSVVEALRGMLTEDEFRVLEKL